MRFCCLLPQSLFLGKDFVSPFLKGVLALAGPLQPGHNFLASATFVSRCCFHFSSFFYSFAPQRYADSAEQQNFPPLFCAKTGKNAVFIIRFYLFPFALLCVLHNIWLFSSIIYSPSFLILVEVVLPLVLLHQRKIVQSSNNYAGVSEKECLIRNRKSPLEREGTMSILISGINLFTNDQFLCRFSLHDPARKA